MSSVSTIHVYQCQPGRPRLMPVLVPIQRSDFDFARCRASTGLIQDKPDGASCSLQLVQQRFRVLQIARVEAFGKP